MPWLAAATQLVFAWLAAAAELVFARLAILRLASPASATELVGRLAMLDWSWMKRPLEEAFGQPVGEEDYRVILTELHRFIAIKVITEDINAKNEFAPHGIMDIAFHMLLLNPFFAATVMKLLDRPGQVLSHVPANRNDHEARVKAYYEHYKAVFGQEPPQKLPSGQDLWPLIEAALPPPAEAPAEAPEPRAEAPAPDGTARAEVLYVKTLAGKTFTYHFQNLQETTVRELALRIEKGEEIPPSTQRLIFSGKQMERRFSEETNQWVGPEVFLSSYGITSGAVVHLVVTLKGC